MAAINITDPEPIIAPGMPHSSPIPAVNKSAPNPIIQGKSHDAIMVPGPKRPTPFAVLLIFTAAPMTERGLSSSDQSRSNNAITNAVAVCASLVTDQGQDSAADPETCGNSGSRRCR